MLARESQRLTAGGQHVDLRAGSEHDADQISGRFQHMLAIVDDEQEAPRRQSGKNHLPSGHARHRRRAQRAHGPGVHRLGLAHGREMDEALGVVEPFHQGLTGGQRQAGLAHLPCPGDAHQPMTQHQVDEPFELRSPPYEARQLFRKAARSGLLGLQPRKLGWQSGGDQLPHVLGGGKIPKPMQAEVDERHRAERHVDEQGPLGVGHEHLTAVRQRRQPSRAVEG
jgi:hypothetical protein